MQGLSFLTCSDHRSLFILLAFIPFNSFKVLKSFSVTPYFSKNPYIAQHCNDGDHTVQMMSVGVSVPPYLTSFTTTAHRETWSHQTGYRNIYDLCNGSLQNKKKAILIRPF